MIRSVQYVYQTWKEVMKAPVAKRTYRMEAFRALTWLLLQSKITRKPHHIIAQRIFGFKLMAYDYETLRSLIREIFVLGIYYVDIKSSSPLIIDGGANIGISSLFFAKVFPPARIKAYEPNPTAFDLLQENISNNHLKQVEVLPYALHNRSGRFSLNTGSRPGWINASLTEYRANLLSEEVETKRLSDEIGDQIVDLLKLDIEGGEWLVINDLVSTTKLKQIKSIVMEFHPTPLEGVCSLDQMMACLVQNGFAVTTRILSGHPEVMLYAHQLMPH